MANYKRAAERYNDRMGKIFADAKRLERESLERGEMPNPNLTDPDTARKYGWEMIGREVKKLKIAHTPAPWSLGSNGDNCAKNHAICSGASSIVGGLLL